MIYIEEADANIVQSMFADIRASDAREVRDSAGLSAEDSILMSMGLSTDSWVVMEDGDPIGVFGVAAIVDKPGVGSPWMMATNRLSGGTAPPHIRANITRAYLKFSKQYIRRMLDTYFLLENYVDVRNEESIRWLKWCGFKFENPVPWGVAGKPFYPFHMERP